MSCQRSPTMLTPEAVALCKTVLKAFTVWHCALRFDFLLFSISPQPLLSAGAISMAEGPSLYWCSVAWRVCRCVADVLPAFLPLRPMPGETNSGRCLWTVSAWVWLPVLF